MNNFISGFMVCYVLVFLYPKFIDIIGSAGIAVLLFTGGWNWAVFAIKKGWIKSGQNSG